MAEKTPTNPHGVGLDKGATLQRLDPVKRIQALAMWRELTNGASVAEVAAKFHVSPHVVRRRLSYGDRAGLFIHHEDVILKSMVPLAENVLIEALIDGDKAVALEIYKGTGLLRKPGTKAPAVAEAGGVKGDSLEDHIARLRQTHDLAETVDAQFTSQHDPLAGLLSPGEPDADAKTDDRV